MLEHVYIQCTHQQQVQIEEAMDYARLMAQAAYDRSLKPDELYKKWFGNPLLSDKIIKDTYSKITITLQTATFKILCLGVPEEYAHVSRYDPFFIAIGGLFWKAPLTGIDSKASTLIHEVSHYAVVTDSIDRIHDYYLAQQYTVYFPWVTWDNSYSIEYYAAEAYDSTGSRGKRITD